MKKIPLFGAGVAGKSLPVTVQRRLNCYMDIRPDGDKAKFVVYGTPGLTVFTDGLSSQPAIRGALASPNYVHFAYTDNLGNISVSTHDATGAQTGSAGFATTSVGGPVSLDHNGTQMMLADGVSGYYTNWDDAGGGALNRILDVDFPNGATTVTSLGGFFVVEKPDSNEFQISGSYDAATWDPLDFATAEQAPDLISAVDSDHGLLIIFGLIHTEFWGISGAQDFPFSPIQTATQEYGLAAKFSRAHVANTIAFLSRNPQGQAQVRWFQGYNAVVISTPDVDAVINSFDTTTDAVALSYVTDGHEMYQLTFPSANRSFLFDCTTQIWSEVQTGTDLIGRHVGNLAVQFQGSSLITDYRRFTVYKTDSTVYTDNGETIKRLIQTRHGIEDGNVYGVDEIFLDMETGVGLAIGQGSDPQIMLQISRDGGRTFGPERWTSIGMAGQYLGPRAIWRRCGSGRDLTARFAMTDPVKFVITYGAASLRERQQ